MTTPAETVAWQETLTLTIRDLVRYAGASGDFNPIHYEDAFARSIGLPGIIVHGMFSMGIIARLVRQHSPGAITFNQLTTRFSGVLLPDREITVSCYPGAVADRDLAIGQHAYRVDARHTGAPSPSVTCQVTVSDA